MTQFDDRFLAWATIEFKTSIKKRENYVHICMCVNSTLQRIECASSNMLANYLQT